jgi:transcriptional regulator with XRE-family HTH domain
MSMSGRMLRYARSRAKLTQRELAHKTGIPQETIARIERGRVDPRIGTLDRLLEGCGFGLEVEPRLGIGIDPTQIRERLDAPMDHRLAIAMADDAHMVEFRPVLRKVAE